MGEPCSKKSKPSYNQWKSKRSNRATLEAGLKGFLCTSNFSEKGSIREAYNLLNAITDKVYPPAPVEEKSQADIADDLDAEINTLKPENTFKEFNFQVSLFNISRQNQPDCYFQSVDTGAKNVVFIKTNLDDPVLLANTIAEEISSTKEQVSQDLIRMVPIEAISKATVEAVTASIEPLLKKHFCSGPKTFGIVINKRLNNGVNKMELIDKVANMVTGLSKEHKVDLKKPEVTILMEIIKSWCLMAILPEFDRFKKYNLVQLSIPEDQAGGNQMTQPEPELHETAME